MAKSGQDQVAMKRPRRSVQSKLSFSSSSQASGSKSAAALPPDAVIEDEEIYSEKIGCMRKINKSLTSQERDLEEESLVASSAKQVHPFFSICRAANRLSETKQKNKFEDESWHSLEGDYGISPVHVFDTEQDDAAVLNWKEWKFLETCLQRFDRYYSAKIPSVFEASTEPLLLKASCGMDAHIDNMLDIEKMSNTYEPSRFTKFYSGQIPEMQPSFLFEMTCSFLQVQCQQVHDGSELSISSTHSSSADANDQDIICKERLASYCQRGLCSLGCSLWTEKYRPEIPLEVCGNADSVKLLSEWLKSWQERVVLSKSFGNNRNLSTFEDMQDSNYDGESDMDELDSGDSIKNVLLITGPVGSGKSATIYACAKEQGFKVIEVNASSLRNGAYMRQTLSGVDSLGLTHWLTEDQANQNCKAYIVENDLEADSNNMASNLFIDDNQEKNSHFHIANKTLFLFEEVDVVFHEDHGFISTIFKLAETTKRPIILTSNTKQPNLPDLLDRLVLNFKAPSYRELLHHASMVCAFEKVNASYSLLDHIIKACTGDIRRILLLLQFWCQGFQGITEKTMQSTKRPIPFGICAVHLAIPKVIPWAFRCELSEKVEEEISRALSALEENSFIKNALQHNASSCKITDPLKKLNTTIAAKSKEKGKLKKHSIIGHKEFSDDMNPLEDFFYDLDSPSACFRKISGRKRHIVLSSQSDDGLSSDDLMPEDISSNQRLLSNELEFDDTSLQANDFNLLAIATALQSRKTYGDSSLLCQMNESKNVVAQNSLDDSDLPSTSHLCDASKIHDLNFMLVSQEVSQTSKLISLYDSNNFLCIQPSVDLNNADENCIKLRKSMEHQSGSEFECFEKDKLKSCQGLSVDDVSSQSLSKYGSDNSHKAASISKTWKRLKSCRQENINLLSSDSKNICLVSNLTSGLTDLISEADIMFSNCNPILCEKLEPSSTSCFEPDSYWFDEQVLMGSTLVQHGLGFYTMKFTEVGSCLGCKDSSNMALEVLASSTDNTALGKLLRHESIYGQNTCFKQCDIKKQPLWTPIGGESAADLYSAILPIVPAKLSMSLKGDALHEYLSFVGHISRFEAFRIAESLAEKPKRRPRSSIHYLSSGSHQLSSEQAKLLAQRSCFTRSNS